MSNNDDFLEELSELANREDDRIWSESHLDGYSDFYKENEASKIWWIDKLDTVGEYLFSFDKKKIYNLFVDYPHNMTDKEVEIFDKENRYWKEFLSNRKK